uniref:CLASP_N domain-containing protein n=1 Tax=Haemonchus contortus TaxID=6289 RepID=A0A7I4YZM4_HAECO
MSDRMDSTYDHVIARCWGSLEEDLPEYLCDEFFRTHGDIDVSEANPPASRVVENEGRHDPQVNSELAQDENLPQEAVEATASENQDGNRLQQPVEAKPPENNGDLTRLAMFSKQNNVLRQSQVQHEQRTVAAATSSASTALSSRHTAQCQTPTRVAVAAPATSVQSSGSQQTGPVSSARTRLTPVSMRDKKAIPTRIPTHTAGLKPGPVRVVSDSQQQISHTVDASTEPTTSRLRSTSRHDRNLAGGPLTRARSKEPGLSSETANEARSTPSDQDNLAISVGQLGVGTERRARDRAPRTNTSSSARNPLRNGPVRIGRCPQPAGILCTSDASLSSATVPSENEFRRELVTRVSSLGPTHRSTSTPRNGSRAVVTSANRCTSCTRRLVATAPRTVSSRTGTGPAGSATAQQCTTSRVTRNENARPVEPRSTVIHSTPVIPREKGDGTPSSAFRRELRRYPAPTGLTPRHRPPTVPKGYGFRAKTSKVERPPQMGSVASSAVEGGPTTSSATEARSRNVLSRGRERALIDRLAVPKNDCDYRVRNVHTHGLSCVKGRSRSSSSRPTSALSNGSAPSSSRALFFSETSRPASTEPNERSEPEAADGVNANV